MPFINMWSKSPVSTGIFQRMGIAMERTGTMKAVFFLSVFFLSVLPCGCDSGGGGSGEESDAIGECSVEEQNSIVWEVMNTSYLWYDQVPETDYKAFESPEALLEHMKYDYLDRWSYITSQEDYYAYSQEGRYIGSGYRLKFDTAGNLRIAMVYADSPADRAGMRRSDIIIGVNGKTIDEIRAANAWDTIFGEDELGVSNQMRIKSQAGETRDVVLVKEWVARHSIIYYDIIREAGHSIGYLVFSNFLAKARADLDPVFAEFKSENVDAVIIDLRYNQGGTGATACYLAGLIAGGAADAEDLFASYLHNDLFADYDEDQYFTDPENELDVTRAVFITTGATCSASELVINGLEPYMDVASVGTTTCGKPVGMHGRDFCDKHISPIEFKVVNALGEGDYYWGMPPTCPSEDDLDRQLGDPDEDSLAKAIGYIVNGVCAEKSDRNSPQPFTFEYVEEPDIGLVRMPGK